MRAQDDLTALARIGLVGVHRGDFSGRTGSIWTQLADAAQVTIFTNLGTLFFLTCATDDAREIQVPGTQTFQLEGCCVVLQIRNTSGGALTATTFAAAITQGTITLPATGFHRNYYLLLQSDGSTWEVCGDNGADLANF